MKAKEIAEKYGLDLKDFKNYLPKQDVVDVTGFGFDTIADKDVEICLADYVQWLQTHHENIPATLLGNPSITQFMEQKQAVEEMTQEHQNALASMLVSSGFSFDGYKIVKYSGYISADEVTRFPTTDIYNYKDQYAQNLTKPLVETRKKAIDKLKNDAAALGCNALIGVSYNYYHFENVAQDHGFAVQPFHFICITASGTAVVIEKE